jgi:hypothetical protein
MYQADDLAVTKGRLKRGRFHELAEAMLRGWELFLFKYWRSYQHYRYHACALGAAAARPGIEPSKLKERFWFERMLAKLPELNCSSLVRRTVGSGWFAMSLSR